MRLYDFVLRNASTNEKQYVRVTLSTPQMGRPLEEAIDFAQERPTFEEIFAVDDETTPMKTVVECSPEKSD